MAPIWPKHGPNMVSIRNAVLKKKKSLQFSKFGGGPTEFGKFQTFFFNDGFHYLMQKAEIRNMGQYEVNNKL